MNSPYSPYIQLKTINLLLALITGRVWGNRGDMPDKLDMWDYKPFMNWVIENFELDNLYKNQIDADSMGGFYGFDFNFKMLRAGIKSGYFNKY